MIETPESSQLQPLCDELAALADAPGWPAEALSRCAEAGFYRWFVSRENGGFGWTSTEIATGYLALSKANLTVTFILTQRVAALRRIAGCENEGLKQRLIPKLLSGEESATVGISHLTTSRRHLAKPALSVVEMGDGFQASGTSPWVTGGKGADWILLGGNLVDESGNADGREILFLAESDSPHVVIKDGFDLIALSASQTGAVTVAELAIPTKNVVAGPVEQVLTGNGGGAGGLQTSVLALGLAAAAIDFIEAEAKQRSDLAATQTSLRSQHEILCRDLFAATDGSAEITAAEIRSPRDAVSAGGCQRSRVCRRSSSRPLVPRGFVFSSLELSATGFPSELR